MRLKEIKDLPDVSFIDNLSLEDVKNILIEEYKKEYENITGKEAVMERSDPMRVLISAQAVLDMQLLSFVDRCGKMNLLKYAQGDFLDHMGAFKNRARKEAERASVMVRFFMAEPRNEVEPIPQGTMVTADQKIFFETDDYAEIPAGELSVEICCSATIAGTAGNNYEKGEIATLVTPTGFISAISNTTKSSGGMDRETDEEYAEGIFCAPSKYSVAGPNQAWVSLVKDFNSDVEDVCPDTVPGSGVAQITVLMKHGRIPEPAELQSIQEYLMRPDIRTLCTLVEVKPPEQKNYEISLTYYIGNSNKSRAAEIQKNVEQAVGAYTEWQDSRVGRDINPDELLVMLKQAGVKRAVITSPVFCQVPDGTVAHFDKTQKVTYGGVESD